MNDLSQAYATAIQLHQQLVAIEDHDPDVKSLTNKADKLTIAISHRWASP